MFRAIVLMLFLTVLTACAQLGPRPVLWQGLAAGMRMMTKPFQMEALAQRVQEMIAARHAAGTAKTQ